MKISFLTFSVFMLISQIQLIGQNTIPKQNKNFEITRIGEHGFCRDGDKFYYKLDVEVKNNTNLKLKRTKLCASINQLSGFRRCSSRIYDSVWYPQSVIKYEMFISDYSIGEYSFDRTPKSILLSIKINAHNIDIDFDELVSKYSIKDDWKDFQKVLGLRDIEPGEKLKILEPPYDLGNNYYLIVFDPTDPLGIIQDKDYKNPSGKFREEYSTNKSLRREYDQYVKEGIYEPFDDLVDDLESQKLRIKYLDSPIIPYFEEVGIVVVEVTVNRHGFVIKAKAGIKGTTIMDIRLLELCKDAALASRYESNHGAPEYQIDTIKYEFIK